MLPPTNLIVNPNAYGGRVGRAFRESASALRAVLGDFSTSYTQGTGDGKRCCQEALAAGARLVIAVGGDGTASEVVAGLLEAGAGPESGIAFGMLPCGTGRDLGRTFAAPTELLAAAVALRNAVPRAIDVGQVDYTTPLGQPARSHFINVASFGMSGLGDQYVNRSRKRLGARLTYLTSATLASLRYSNAKVALSIDGGAETVQTIYTVAIANGRYFGGGMLIAPDAQLDDGLLDVVVLGDLALWEAARLGLAIYKGRHLDCKKVSVGRARKVAARPLASTPPVLLDVDGENPGQLPATFQVLPRTLLVRV